MHTSWLLLPLLILGLPGCPKPYSGRAAVSEREMTGDVGGYVELGAYLEPGTSLHTGAPRAVTLREARCMDESVCETALRDGKALVGGKKEGASDVRLTFVQPNGGELTVQTVEVRFRARAVTGFTVGPQPPAASALRELDLGAGTVPSKYRCFSQTLSFLDAGDVTRGDARTYACTPGVELAPGRWYLPSGEHPTHSAPTALFVCQRQLVGSSERTSLVVYRNDATTGPAQLSYTGEPSDVCRVK